MNKKRLILFLAFFVAGLSNLAASIETCGAFAFNKSDGSLRDIAVLIKYNNARLLTTTNLYQQYGSNCNISYDNETVIDHGVWMVVTTTFKDYTSDSTIHSAAFGTGKDAQSAYERATHNLSLRCWFFNHSKHPVSIYRSGNF